MSRNNASLGVQDPHWLKVIELASLCSLPMALNAAIKLNVFEILTKAAAGSELSCDEIVAGIAAPSPQASVSLDRILRLLASHSILTSSLVTDGYGKAVRKYGITPLCKFLILEDNGSLAPLVLLLHDKVFMETWQHLHEAVLDGVEPFTRAHGKSIFLYGQDDLRWDKLFNFAMANHTKLLVQTLLDTYEGFHGLRSLVDVGGGLGSCLNMIVSRYPHIRGINFDQPHVIAAAPAYPGVQHVGGDMFQSVPSADAIFMKWILHDWSDEHCVKLLRNCYVALPEKGKAIVVDAVIPAAVETGLRARCGYQMDLLMLAYSQGGKERTEDELKDLAQAAGFTQMKVICMLNDYSVVEFYKQC